MDEPKATEQTGHGIHLTGTQQLIAAALIGCYLGELWLLVVIASGLGKSQHWAWLCILVATSGLLGMELLKRNPSPRANFWAGVFGPIYALYGLVLIGLGGVVALAAAGRIALVGAIISLPIVLLVMAIWLIKTVWRMV